MNDGPTRSRSPVEELALAAAVLALGVALAAGATPIGPGLEHEPIGPRFFPYLVSIGLVVLGLRLAVSGMNAQRSPRSAAPAAAARDAISLERRDALGRIVMLALGLALGAALLDPAGFVPAAALVFTCAARALGSRAAWRDALIGLVLALVVFVGFTSGLGLTLPAGWWAD